MPRVHAGAEAASLAVLRTVRVIGRVGKDPLFDVFVLAHASGAGVAEAAKTAPVDVVVVRDSDGEWTTEYQAVLRDMGWWLP